MIAAAVGWTVLVAESEPATVADGGGYQVPVDPMEDLQCDSCQ